MTQPTQNQKPVEPITEQAVAWFVRMQSDQRTRGDESRFEQWLKHDPSHAHAYARVEKAWRVAGSAINPRMLESDNDARLPEKMPSRRPWWPMLATAAALVIIIFGTLVLDGHRRISTGMYETQVGAQRELKLADGSTIVLNTNSEVSVDLAEHQRSVRLIRGEARFQVAKNPSRPFIVDAGVARVRAVGTAFDVRRSEERVAVTLVEGRVEVTPAESSDESPVPTFLTAGQQLSVEIGTGTQHIETVSLDRISAWLHRQLVFNSTPLAAAVNEANRYLPIQITIGDPSVERIPISGVVRAGNADSFVSALESAFPVQAITAADGQITLIRRQGDKQR